VKAAANVPQVTNLEQAIRVDEQVARLEVPVQHVGTVKVQEPPEQLEHQKLDVVRVETRLRVDHLRQIARHDVKHKERVLEGAHIRRQQQVTQLHEVLVAPQQTVELDLTQDADGHRVRLEHGPDALDSHLISLHGVKGGGNDAISTLCARTHKREGGEEVEENWGRGELKGTGTKRRDGDGLHSVSRLVTTRTRNTTEMAVAHTVDPQKGIT